MTSRLEEVRELVGLLGAYYHADSDRRGSRGPMAARRQAQVIALTEVQRVLDNRKDTLLWLRDLDLVELSPSDLEEIAQGRTVASDAEADESPLVKTAERVVEALDLAVDVMAMDEGPERLARLIELRDQIRAARMAMTL